MQNERLRPAARPVYASDMDTLLQDIRFGLRQLRRTPIFAAVALLTLAIGIGANTAVFSVMNAVMLRMLPVRNPEQLVYLHITRTPPNSSQTGFSDTSLSEPVFQQLRNQKDVFDELIGYVPLSTTKTVIRMGQEPEEALADMVSGNFFTWLGVSAARGRVLSMDDETGHTQAAVLSYRYWTARLGRNPSVLGQPLYIKGTPFTIVGIAAPDFDGVEANSATDLWVPFQTDANLKPWGRAAQDKEGLYSAPNWWFLITIGRLRSGVTPAQAEARLQPAFLGAAYQAIGTPDPKEEKPRLFFSSARGVAGLNDDFAQPLKVLMGMVGLVLVIACANVAMLLVARNATRRREFALRMALGGRRARIARQLLTESLLLVAGGAAIGWFFAVWATRALAAWSQLNVNLAPDRTVLLFNAGISLLAALAFGLAPLWSVVRIPIGLVLKSSANRRR